MAKKKKEELEQTELVQLDGKEPKLVEGLAYKTDKIESQDEFGKPIFKKLETVYKLTVDVNNDKLVSLEKLVSTTDSAESIGTAQQQLGKIILSERQKANENK